MERCEGCAELSQQVHDLKTFIAEWFTVLLQRFDSHDRNMHLLLNSIPPCTGDSPEPALDCDDSPGRDEADGSSYAGDSPVEPPAVSSTVATHNGGTKIVISKAAILAPPTAVSSTPTPPPPLLLAKRNGTSPSPATLSYVNIAPKLADGTGTTIVSPKRSLLLHRKEPVSKVMPSTRIEARFVTADNTCMKCGNKFRYRSNAFRHVKVVHLMDMKHKCPFCDKTFRWKEAIKRHVRAMHPAQVGRLPAILAYFGANEVTKFDREKCSIEQEDDSMLHDDEMWDDDDIAMAN